MFEKPENLFFLPTTDGLKKEWDGDQLLYCECCIYGANRIASLLQKNPQTPIIELYDIAADVRYNTAQLMRKPEYEYTYYGVYYFPFNERSLVVDPVEYIPGSRWGDTFCEVLNKLNKLCQGSYDQDDFTLKNYGNGFRTYAEKKDDRWNYTLKYRFDNTKEILISKIEHTSENLILVKHVPASCLNKYLQLIEKKYTKLIQSNTNNLDETIELLLEFRQQLFHSTPLVKGSQSATQMVIAGIMLYKGIRILPFIPEFDHFLDAELFTHVEYREKGFDHFESKPEILSDIRIEYDENFFSNKFKEFGISPRDIYAKYKCIEEKIDNYLLNSIYRLDILHSIKTFKINSVDFLYKDGTIEKIAVKCDNNLNMVVANKAIDFFGKKELLRRIGEESFIFK